MSVFLYILIVEVYRAWYNVSYSHGVIPSFIQDIKTAI